MNRKPTIEDKKELIEIGCNIAADPLDRMIALLRLHSFCPRWRAFKVEMEICDAMGIFTMVLPETVYRAIWISKNRYGTVQAYRDLRHMLDLPLDIAVKLAPHDLVFPLKTGPAKK